MKTIPYAHAQLILTASKVRLITDKDGFGYDTTLFCVTFVTDLEKLTVKMNLRPHLGLVNPEEWTHTKSLTVLAEVWKSICPDLLLDVEEEFLVDDPVPLGMQVGTHDPLRMIRHLPGFKVQTGGMGTLMTTLE